MGKKQEQNGYVAVLDKTLDEVAEELEQNLDGRITPTEDEPAPDSEAAVLKRVKTFDQMFAEKPETAKAILREFGEYAAETFNGRDSGFRYFNLGRLFDAYQIEEMKRVPGSYDRAVVSEDVKNTARAFGVAESLNQPHEFAACYWLVRLARSTPGDGPGVPRTWDHSAVDADWFSGNLSYGTLRKLLPTIKRVSGNNSLDEWEFNPDWEPWVRDIITRLRNGSGLSAAGVEALYKAKKAALAKAREAASHAGLTKEEIESIAESERIEKREKKLRQLSEDVVNVRKYASKELGMTPADLRTFLADKSVIPADPKLNIATIEGLASSMTPVDAKTLVQTLMKLYLTDPSRLPVLKALVRECANAVNQMKSAAEESKRNVA
jgi:hypothetical protein